MTSTTCCFTGHRHLPSGEIGRIIERLSDEIDRLYRRGVKQYISGGAIGFDQLAAAMVISKRALGLGIRLTFALPCENQDARWTSDQRADYRALLRAADAIIYVSREYASGCMRARNRYMADNSAYCICALLRERSGTGQTVRYARGVGVEIINVAAGEMGVSGAHEFFE